MELQKLKICENGRLAFPSVALGTFVIPSSILLGHVDNYTDFEAQRAVEAANPELGGLRSTRSNKYGGSKRTNLEMSERARRAEGEQCEQATRVLTTDEA